MGYSGPCAGSRVLAGRYVQAWAASPERSAKSVARSAAPGPIAVGNAARTPIPRRLVSSPYIRGAPNFAIALRMVAAIFFGRVP